MLPDVWRVSRNVVFCPSIKVLLCTSGGWADALIFCPLKINKEQMDSEHTGMGYIRHESWKAIQPIMIAFFVVLF